MLSMKAMLAILFVGMTAASQDEILDTPNYTITIKGCDEYVVSCDNVKYKGVNKKNGKSITLTGRTVHSTGADGITPSQFLGYEFTNCETIYFVGADGELLVTRGTNVLVDERGIWK